MLLALLVVGSVFGLGGLIAAEAASQLREVRVDTAKRALTAIASSARSQFEDGSLSYTPLLASRLATLVKENPELTQANVYDLAGGKPQRLASNLDAGSNGSARPDPVDAADVLPLRTGRVRYSENSSHAAEMGFPFGPGARPVAVLGLFFNLKPLEAAVAHRERRLLVMAAAAALLAALLVVLVLELRLFRRLRELTAATQAVRQGREGVRLAWSPHGELGSLAYDFDEMAAAIEEREHLRTLSTTDALTGLANQRSFHKSLDRELARCKRYGGRFTVAMLDLDGFKAVNDHYGHAAGDRLLTEVGQLLQAGCRPSDTVARVGGDEFAILMAECGRDDATWTAQRLARAVEAIDGPVGISFGVAEWPADGSDKEAVLLYADTALYAAKPGSDERRRVAVAGRLANAIAEPSTRPRGARRSSLGMAHVERIQRVLAVAREELAMDVTYLSEFERGEQVIRAVAGDGESFGIEPAARIPLSETYCARMVAGEIPNLIPDTTRHEAVSTHPATLESKIGAYVGIPLRLSTGQLYGTLCCTSHDPGVHLGPRDVAFMHVLARLLSDQLEQAEHEAENVRLDTESSTADALLVALDARDGYTRGHSEQVVALSVQVATRLGVDAEALSQVRQVGLLHDIGKIAIPDSVLHKNGPLDEAEWCLAHRHPVIGAQIVSSIPALAHLAPAVQAEHECWDGTGYPDQLRGEAIPLAARIVFACDAFYAMTSDRPYRTAMPASDALAELADNAGSQFDPAVVQILIEILESQAGATSAPQPDTAFGGSAPGRR